MPRKVNVMDRTGWPIGEVRCPSCNKLLTKEVERPLVYSMESKCPRCSDITLIIRRTIEK